MKKLKVELKYSVSVCSEVEVPFDSVDELSSAFVKHGTLHFHSADAGWREIDLSPETPGDIDWTAPDSVVFTSPETGEVLPIE